MTRHAIDLGGTWRLRPEGAADWGPVRVPSFWEADGRRQLDGLVTYAREVDVPDDARFATIEFGAVADLCEVFVNDVAVGHHEVGFTPFAFDVTHALRPGAQNAIRVEVEDPPVATDLHLHTVQGKQGWGNRPFPSPPSLYFTYGGIWRPCRLALHGPAYLTDLWCDLDPVEPMVGVSVANRSGSELDVAVEVRAFERKELVFLQIPVGEERSGTARFRGEGIDRWSPAAPNLHRVSATARVADAVSHEMSITTGLRRVERVGDDVLIDGAPYRMRSALHQGFWPRGLYAADPEMIERDIRLALDCGLNTLRTHLKAFEPEWLDAADRAGLLLQCDTPIGEPLDVEAFDATTRFGQRCVTAVREQIRRDRSRPAIVMWTLMNEIALTDHALLERDGYRRLVSALWDEAVALDPSRPIIENDWIVARRELVRSDIRTPHWYGRGSAPFLARLDERLAETAAEDGPLYVTEFGEWGLPDPEGGDEFWNNERDLAAQAGEAGWDGDFASFAAGTQLHQGWADRLHAERVRTASHVLGFCLTEWTDVPHELNGLVSLRREVKRAAVDAFRPALADVCPIAVVGRYAFAVGEQVDVRVFLSNWSAEPVGRTARVTAGGEAVALTADAPAVVAGGVAEVGRVQADVGAAGSSELVVEAAGSTARWPLWVVPSPAARAVEVPASDALRGALEAAGWVHGPGAVLVVSEDVVDEDSVAELESLARAGRPLVVLAQSTAVPAFGAVEPIPQGWGPTPFAFTSDELMTLPSRRVLGPEIYACAPTHALPEVRGSVTVVVPPPVRRWGAVVAERRVSAGAIVACQLRIQEAIVRGDGFALALLGELCALAANLCT